MAYIPDSRKKEIQDIANKWQWKSLAKIASENWIYYYEVDLSDIKKSSWLIFKSKWSWNFVIFIEKSEPSNRKRFTFAHELWHYFLHKKYIQEQIPFIDTDETFALFRPENINELSEDMKLLEAEANWFASELLMPEELVRKAYIELWYNIQALSELFLVSWQAITYRLINLSLIK